MAQKILYGNVSKDGTRYSGSTGWVSSRQSGTGDGHFEVLFDEMFDTIPTVILTQNYPEWNDFSSDGGDTRDNAVLIAVDERHFVYKTGDSGGSGKFRNCGFLVIGEKA